MMKTTLVTTLAALFLLAGCAKEIKLEVKNVHETDVTAQWKVTIDRPAFSTTEENVEQSCVIFNDEITGLVNGIQAAFIEQTKEAVAELESAHFQQSAPYELIIQDSVFLADENYISVRMLSYEYSGGAHGNTTFYGVNYNVKTKQFLDKKEILNYQKAAEINALLKEYLQDPDSCFTFDAPTVDNFTALNITLHTIDFTYAQYILGPYSCGHTTIAIPRGKMEGMLLK